MFYSTVLLGKDITTPTVHRAWNLGAWSLAFTISCDPVASSWRQTDFLTATNLSDPGAPPSSTLSTSVTLLCS